MKGTLVRRNSFWLALSLVLMVLSSIVASAVQTSGYTVTVKDMSWETSNGESMSALLFKPNGVSADNKAPAIIVSHGWWNNKEMQDANYVELARRGYVVVSIDMYGHGDSDYLKYSDLAANGTGMYDAVKLVADLPYVDPRRSASRATPTVPARRTSRSRSTTRRTSSSSPRSSSSTTTRSTATTTARTRTSTATATPVSSRTNMTSSSSAATARRACA